MNVIETDEDIEFEYRSEPGDVLAFSAVSECYDIPGIIDIIETSMTRLYNQVNIESQLDEFIQISHIPIYRKESFKSQTYTSYYMHNQLNISVFEQYVGKLFVQFRITPLHNPTTESQEECDRIEEFVANVIYDEILDHCELYTANQIRDMNITSVWNNNLRR